ncbi:hypothetical protein BMS3Bbin16_01010 [archaeon BMS3Bbin16]|nr:hypothetical protein BMS3Bbin16_01010 [archaeon BMS3Bbin16]
MSKEEYKKPELKSDTVKIGTYGQYDVIAPNCGVVSETCCDL